MSYSFFLVLFVLSQTQLWTSYNITILIKSLMQGNRIDAIIPNALYRHNFKKNLKEGEWYFMSDFNVVPQNPISRYSWHPFMIQCKWETKMVHITPRSINNYLDFIDYDEIKYAGTQEKEHVTGKFYIHNLDILSRAINLNIFVFLCRCYWFDNKCVSHSNSAFCLWYRTNRL